MWNEKKKRMGLQLGEWLKDHKCYSEVFDFVVNFNLDIFNVHMHTYVYIIQIERSFILNLILICILYIKIWNNYSGFWSFA